MAQFIFPPLTASLDSEQVSGGALPSKQMITGGYHAGGSKVYPLAVDADGQLQIDVVSAMPLPTGAATSALQTAGNNILTTIDADTSSLAGAVSGSELQVDVVASLPAGTNAIGKLAANSGVDIGDVDVLSSALPTGAATSALQTTANGILTTIDADTGTLAGAVSGTEMQVDVVASLPAGSNNIGDVDVLSVIPGVGATNLGKAIQSAQGTTDTGVPALVVRNDTLADLAGSDHDYAPLQVNASGALYVEVKTSGLPSGAATEAKQDTIETTLTAIETDADTIAGAVSGTEMQVDIVASLPAGTNEIGKLAAGTASIGTVILGTGSAQIGKLAANSGVDIGDVDVTSLPALAAGSNTIGKVDVNAIAPVDFLDAGVFDASTGTNIPSTGSATLVTLAAACTEIEVVDDIGEYMSLRVGGAVKAYLPLGGGRVKVTLAATNAVTLYSETGTTISSGKIAINFLG